MESGAEISVADASLSSTVAFPAISVPPSCRGLPREVYGDPQYTPCARGSA